MELLDLYNLTEKEKIDGRMSMEEIWKDIQGYEGLYQVSNLGRIKRIRFINNVTNKPQDKFLSMKKIDNLGYQTVALCKDGQIKYKRTHRIVAETFIPNPQNLPCVNHKDGNKLNNLIDNLEWCTYSQNTRHAMSSGLINIEKHKIAVQNNMKIAHSYCKEHHLYAGENNYNAKLKKEDILEIKKIYQNKEMQIKQIALKYNVCTSTISRIVHNKSWTNI